VSKIEQGGGSWRSRVATAVVAPIVILALVSCGGRSTGSSGSTTTTVSAPTTSVVVATDAPTSAPLESGPTMPDVVCMNLQDAQDKIQESGVFYSRSHDATGRDRFQVIDRNWIVVAQTPAVGTPIGEGDAVLDVVKYGEENPCGA
jgi:hypothetical protein